MKIILGKTSGFCYGVKNAVEKAEKIVEKNNVYCIGELVHNKQVVDNFKRKGMIVLDKIENVPDGEEVIFRAHGMPKQDFEYCKSKNIKINDLACPNVTKLHNKVIEKNNEYFIILVGKKDHPENIATISYSEPKNSFVLEDLNEIENCYNKFEKSNKNKIYVLFQTTYNTKKSEIVSKVLKEKFATFEIIIDNTICMATEIRQNETKEISKKVDKMIIIGGKNSSNTLKLVEISKEFCNKVYHIETKEELNKYDFLRNDIIGIMAGASTPKYIIDDVYMFLDEIFE